MNYTCCLSAVGLTKVTGNSYSISSKLLTFSFSNLLASVEHITGESCSSYQSPRWNGSYKVSYTL